jgi:hypothetical protein
MSRPITIKAKPGKNSRMSVLLDGAVLQALDEEALRMAAAQPGLEFTRTDALRVVLYNWMNAQKDKDAK